MLTKKDFEDTLQMLNACNGPALILSLAEIMPRIWEEARHYNKGTNWVCSHPITLLWIGKIADLSYGRDAPMDKWGMAYTYCNAKVNDMTTTVNPGWTPENEYEG